MAKFNVGDRVKIDNCNIYCAKHKNATSVVVNVDNESVSPFCVSDGGAGRHWVNGNESKIELIKKGNKVKERRTFKLLKDTPTVRKGALLQEDCDDGTQPYSFLSSNFNKTDSITLGKITDRSLVEEQPQWFVEVFKVTPEYMTQLELDQWNKFKK